MLVPGKSRPIRPILGVILLGLSWPATSMAGDRWWWTDYIGHPPRGGVENLVSGMSPYAQPIPYRTDSGLYGYQDYVYGRGPVLNLGSAALQPGFRGYGVLGRHGYGLGMRPTSAIDQPPPRRKCLTCGGEFGWGHQHP